MQEIVRNYLALPDTGNTGKGMVDGGLLSPLLAALYLLPLDTAMDEMQNKDGILYRRFMDNFVILAPTSWKLRKAIQRVHAVLKTLVLALHKEKRFIGKSVKGFNFLGYRIHPDHKLRLSGECIRRMKERARQLYERGVSMARLRQYVTRWCQWLWGGVGDRVSVKGGFTKNWVYVLKQLNITGATTTP